MGLEIIIRYLNNPALRSPTGIMKVCLAISLLFHFSLLFGFQKVFPSIWGNQGLKTYNVEIIRPPTEDLESENLENSVDSLDQEEDIPLTEAQDTIALDTKDPRYSQYMDIISTEISRNWNYPAEAKLNLMEGEVMALFSLMRDGSIIQIGIEKSSGHDILDSEVLRAIRASVPFSSFPESIQVNRLNIKAKFDYRLSMDKGEQ